MVRPKESKGPAKPWSQEGITGWAGVRVSAFTSDPPVPKRTRGSQQRCWKGWRQGREVSWKAVVLVDLLKAVNALSKP